MLINDKHWLIMPKEDYEEAAEFARMTVLLTTPEEIARL
jgi:hypothetical protein